MQLSKRQQKILLELEKRNKLNNIDFTIGSFPGQVEFIVSTAKYKAALTNRRAGKSTAAALMMFYHLTKNSNYKCLYVGLTKDTAKGVVWDALKEINEKFQVGCQFKQTYKDAIIFPNKSSISFFGLNDNEKEKEKILGMKLKMSCIDEAASYNIDLQAAIQRYITPCLIDLDGQLVIMGTPGNNRNYFCDITEGRVPGYEIHKWMAWENPYVKENYLAEMERLYELYGKDNCLADPGFRQHYLGEWTIDTENIPYKFKEDKNGILGLPGGKQYFYILSIDIGWEDDNAFVIAAWSPEDKSFYIVESFSKNKMMMNDIIEQIRKYETKYASLGGISRYLIDSANKQYVQELKYRSNIPFEAATKTDKMNYVYMMNSDYILGKIKVISSQCQSLITEYGQLSVNKENPSHPFIVGGDHNADAALYAWRSSFNYTAQEPVIWTPPSPEEKVNQFWDQEEDKLSRRQSSSFIDSDWENY